MKLQKFLLSKYKLLVLALFLFLLIPNNVNAIVRKTDDFYVNDAASILSNDTKEYIINSSAKLNKVDGTQIVVVTVTDLEGMSIEEYASKLFKEYGIGSKDKNNGLLLLLALKERKFRVEVGDGLGGILPDGKTGRFQDEYIIPYLKNNEWDKGIRNGYDAFYSEIVKQNNLNISYVDPVSNNAFYENSAISIIVFIMFFIGLISGSSYLKNKSFSILIDIVSMILILMICKELNIITILQWSATVVTNSIVTNFIGFIFGVIMSVMGINTSSRGSGGYHSSFYSSSGGFSSGSGFSGGGGSSSGGGSTRGF